MNAENHDKKIERAFRKVKDDYNFLLVILSKIVSKKYELTGYATDYIMDSDGVQVVFQRVGHYDKQKLSVKFDEIKVDE